jgi:hypothetical protein
MKKVNLLSFLFLLFVPVCLKKSHKGNAIAEPKEARYGITF